MADEPKLNLYGAIAKFDACADGSLIVSGIASSEIEDSQGEIVTADAMREALGEYLAKGSVREMHQPSAVGRPLSAFVNDNGETEFSAHIVDADAIIKIKAGVYKGFSIAGKALAKVGNKVTKLLLKTIDVVDIPSNPKAYFNVIKFDKPDEDCQDKNCRKHTEHPMKKCKHCDEPMEKCGGNCEGHKTEKAHMKKVDDLADGLKKVTEAVEALTKGLTSANPVNETITKMQAELGELRKARTDDSAAALQRERESVLAKMDAQGRVPMNPETNTAYTLDDLNKMDLPMLKFAAANAPIIPTQAKTIFKGKQSPEDAAIGNLKGEERVEKAWEGTYGTLAKMQDTFAIHN